MDYVNLGPSGLKVSRLCLGCMSYGDTSKGWHGDWVLSEDESRPFIREAVEAGINFFDTAEKGPRQVINSGQRTIESWHLNVDPEALRIIERLA